MEWLKRLIIERLLRSVTQDKLRRAAKAFLVAGAIAAATVLGFSLPPGSIGAVVEQILPEPTATPTPTVTP
jgi:hypothetical protein